MARTSNKPSSNRNVFALPCLRLLLLAGPLALTACGNGVLEPRGPVGAADRTLLIDSLAIMLVIVVPTIVATVGFAWWFRASNKRARYLPDWSYSGLIEMVVWAIPVMVVLLLGGVAWIGSHLLDPARPLESKAPALDVQVVSLDWKWLFIYPKEGVASVNDLVVPAGVPLHFTLTSSSVMNTFFIPQLGSMIYTMNGMATHLYLQADEPGVFRGLSGHYSGEGFSDMHFEVRAVSAAQFAAWVESTQAPSGPVLDATSYTALARQSINVPPMTFRSVSPDLFHDIVMLKIAPGPGPQIDQAAAVRSSEKER
jgi:cytochrome o ubiquinol oxidase subunit 2